MNVPRGCDRNAGGGGRARRASWIISTLAIPERFLEVVEALVGALPLDEVDWALTGSLAHRLQGADLEVHDVDVQTDERGAYEVGSRLRRHVVDPVAQRESEHLRSHFGTLRIADVTVEVMGAIQKRRRDGTWADPVDPRDHRVLVALAGGRLAVPVMSLVYEAAAYEQIGRPDRARLLRRALGR